MITAELHGKAPRASRASEDMLMSAVWGRLRYLPFASGVGAVLARARPWRTPRSSAPGNAFPWADLNGVVEWSFWPKARCRRDGRLNECDLLLVLQDAAGKQWALLIEAKYWASKSQRTVPTVDAAGNDGDTRSSGDQLARYLDLLHDRQFAPLNGDDSVHPAGIVYLTAHAAPPKVALDESVDEARRLGLRAPRVSWLSWVEIERAVREAPEPESPGERLVRADILALLRRRSLFAFHGFTQFPPVPAAFRCAASRFQTAPPPLRARWRPRDLS